MWIKIKYLLIGVLLIAHCALTAVLKRQRLLDELSWESILLDISYGLALLVIGMDMMRSPYALLDILGRPLAWYRPSKRMFFVVGFLAVVGGVAFLLFNVLDALAALGVIPNPYVAQ